MARPIPEDELRAIEKIVGRHDEGITTRQIADELPDDLPRRTLQYRLQRLVEENRLAKEGERRWTKYRLPVAERRGEPVAATEAEGEGEDVIPLSKQSAAIRDYLRQPSEARKPVGYDRDFLKSYRPGVSFYLSQDERAHLAKVGKPQIAEQPAGTYAKQILNRLLSDLSWNSSRLEGNTYSLLDTRPSHRVWRRSRRAGPPGSSDDPQSQGCHRVFGQRSRRHRLQPLYDSQSSRHARQQPATR